MENVILCTSRSLPRPFNLADSWIFDLDNTLYPESCRLFDQVDKNITNYICKYLGLEWKEAYRVQKSFFREHGTTMRGLMVEYGIDPHHFLKYVHEIDLSPIAPNPRLELALSHLPGQKIIFTNGSEEHAKNVIEKLGIHKHFQGIVDIVAADYQPKPERRGYEKLVEDYNVCPSSSIMIEDMAQNLKPAHDMGMTCVLVQTENKWGRERNDSNYVHYTIGDLSEWLGTLTGV